MASHSSKSTDTKHSNIGQSGDTDNHVNSSNVKDQCVTSSKVKDQCVTSSKVKDQCVTSSKVKDQCVTSSRVKDHCVTSKSECDKVTKDNLDNNTDTLKNHQNLTASSNPSPSCSHSSNNDAANFSTASSLHSSTSKTNKSTVISSDSSNSKCCQDSDSSSGSSRSNLAPKIGSDLDIPDNPFGDEYTDRRLWIGNLDTRLTEFAMLKIVQQYGDLRKMDFVYHKGGPDKGKSKGYCFVSFHTWEAADKARRHLDGKLIMRRPMLVKWAKGMQEQMTEEDVTSTSGPTVSSMPVTCRGKFSKNKSVTATSEAVSADAKIAAIEAKLKMMQDTSLNIGDTIKPPPGWTPLVRANERSRPYKKSHSHHGNRHPRR